MAFSSRSSGNAPMSEINVTPLVDVMLVLLIIFMVTAPLLQQGVKVDLPDAQAEPMKTSTEERLVLTLAKDGKAYLGKTEIPVERITDLLSGNEKLKIDKELYLHADQELPYGLVVRVMAAAKAGGAETLAMVTDPEAPPPRGAIPLPAGSGK
ncbi:MAG: protein TolR [Deltaproteobacteria bacterium RBG_16_71_12]|nr:MAG: protein TolR [Deltaproteobacteria bacterium RBG_16_71_12]